MIDEKKLIEVMERWKRGGIEEHEQSAFNLAIDLIKIQPKTGEWIPVEERLPEEKGDYLVSYHPCYWDEVKQDTLVGIDHFMGKTSWSKRKYQRVIAWKEIEEPYIEDKYDR